MIVTRIGGGLGNQMFQYAMARALALRTGQLMLLDTRPLNSDPLRTYELDIFNIAGGTMGKLNGSWVRFFTSPRTAPFANLFRMLMPRLSFTVARDPFTGFKQEFFALSGNKYLDGNWQSEKYFADHAQAIRRDFTFKEPPDGQNHAMIEQIKKVQAVALHIRRGDIAADPTLLAKHGLCDLDYYERAMAHIASQVPAAHLFVFSDDPQWARENLKTDLPATFVAHNTGPRNREDMRLMTYCRHFVIANSTFSWWGAWLSPSPDKIVIAPRRWFADKSMSDKDVVPDRWIRM